MSLMTTYRRFTNNLKHLRPILYQLWEVKASSAGLYRKITTLIERKVDRLGNLFMIPFRALKVKIFTSSRNLHSNIQNDIRVIVNNNCCTSKSQNFISDEPNNDSGISRGQPVAKQRKNVVSDHQKFDVSKMACLKCGTRVCGDHKNQVCDYII